MSQIIPFGVIWLLFGCIFLTVEYAATKDYGYTPAGIIALDFEIVVFGLTSVMIVGLLVGLIEVLFMNRLFSSNSFIVKMMGKLATYSVVLFLIICITYPIAASIELDLPITDRVIWNKFSDFLSSIGFLNVGFQMAISLGASLFYAEIGNNIGQGVLLNFVIGKYHRPQEEERIFMFLDMKSSTYIAEKIGHRRYFEFLKAYYNTLSNALIDHYGEIYQYVGDEMVVSWKVEDGLSNNNCIRCFFKMKQALAKKQDWFKSEFGLYPEFKAGLHVGVVTTGEIGNVKQDIIFTGDVLNTTARIQCLCNMYEVDILVSEDLVTKLNLPSNYQVTSLGSTELRGKVETMELYTLSEIKAVL